MKKIISCVIIGLLGPIIIGIPIYNTYRYGWDFILFISVAGLIFSLLIWAIKNLKK